MKRQTRPHPGRRLPSTVAGARVSHPTALFPWRARGRRVVRPCRGEILARTGLLLAIILAGCAPVPRFGPPPTVGPPYFPPPEPVWVVLDPKLYGYADSTAVGSTHRPTEARPARARARPTRSRRGSDRSPRNRRGRLARSVARAGHDSRADPRSHPTARTRHCDRSAARRRRSPGAGRASEPRGGRLAGPHRRPEIRDRNAARQGGNRRRVDGAGARGAGTGRCAGGREPGLQGPAPGRRGGAMNSAGPDHDDRGAGA